MIHRVKLPALPALLVGATLLTAALGCSKSDEIRAGVPSEPSTGGAGTGPSAAAGTGNGSTVGGGSGTCEGSVIADDKRVVRLSFNQISHTIHALLGDSFGAKADAEFEIG